MLAGEEAIAQAGIGSKAHFPGPLFFARRRSKSNGITASPWPKTPA